MLFFAYRSVKQHFSCFSKGKAEKFNSTVEKFISEAVLKKPTNVAEYNELLRVWIDEYYHKSPHAGLGGISPATAFGADKRPLKFASAIELRDAFFHMETRKVDKTGCIKFEGHHYEVGLAYIGRDVAIRFDPSWTEELEVIYEQSAPFVAKKLVIGENCGTTQKLPEHMRTTPPQTSRMLDALKKQHHANHHASGIATSFEEYWEGGHGKCMKRSLK